MSDLGTYPEAQELTRHKGKPGTSASNGTSKQYVLQNDWVSVSSDSSDELEHLCPAKPPQQTIRRRLVRGCRPRVSSPDGPQVNPGKLSAARVKVIDLVSDDDHDNDDEEDNYQPGKDSHHHSGFEENEEQELNDRVLAYLNSCDAIGLMAIANIKEASAKAMVSRQPFHDLSEAQAVAMAQKKRGKKSAKVVIGEDIVYAVKSYARALDSIDRVIAVCEDNAKKIKSVTSKWNIDQTGQCREEFKNADDKILTPHSAEGSTRLMDVPLRQPKLMTGCVMKPFQIYGLNWLYLLYKNQHGAILADDMGLGKTCQVISLMCSIVEQWERTGGESGPRPWPNLIIVPPSTLENWENEFKKFAPKLRVTKYQGSQAARDDILDEILDDPSNHHVILTSYSQLTREKELKDLAKCHPKVAVFDEGHKMKNPNSQFYKRLLKFKNSWRLVLSGTPVQNNLMEMIALLRFVSPNLFTAHFETLEELFSQKFSLADVSKGALLRSERVDRARTILEPFILQRRKEQVLKDLPPKLTRIIKCQMDPVQAALYKEYERRFKKSGVQNSLPSDNNIWMQLRKAAIHPQLFRRFYKDKDIEKMASILFKKVPQRDLKQPKLEHLVNELKALSDFELHLWCRDYSCIKNFDLPKGSWLDCAKVRELLKLIRGYMANGDRALVFTRFAKVLEILSECLADENIPYLALQGNTSVDERQDMINEFNSNENIPVFLLTTGSGGTGVNLASANKVILFDLSDNPQDDIQAENRAHRLGQTRPVEVIRLISEGTIEELVHKACEKKLELANKVTGWTDVSMTSEEMEKIVKQSLLSGEGVATPLSND